MFLSVIRNALPSSLSAREVLGRLLPSPVLPECHKNIILFSIKSKGRFATGYNEDRIMAKILIEGLFF